MRPVRYFVTFVAAFFPILSDKTVTKDCHLQMDDEPASDPLTPSGFMCVCMCYGTHGEQRIVLTQGAHNKMGGAGSGRRVGVSGGWDNEEEAKLGKNIHTPVQTLAVL